jgi:hypothetical protein
MKTTRILTELDGFDEATDYVMVTNNEAFLAAHPAEVPEDAEPEAKTLWTDKRHNLFEALTTDTNAIERWVTRSAAWVRFVIGGFVIAGLLVLVVIVLNKRVAAPASPPAIPPETF